MNATTIVEAEKIEVRTGDAASAAGFRSAGLHCGVKREKPDLALLVSDVPASVAGVFTTNKVKAAPVRYTQAAVERGRAQAIVVNSGNANACTGNPGLDDAAEMARLTGEALDVDPELVLVASTGVIGVPLPMDAIRSGIPLAARALAREGAAAAEAIRTTDRFAKTAAVRLEIGGVPITIGGMAKGAGMIHPNMATTLCFLTTDAAIPPAVLRLALTRAIAGSFNSITVDGDTSTNDTALLLANGRAGGSPITN
ncbi:MAG: bifunctional ornithine acetyltransferase/N-acetylglutamate synthase, partial [Acidobacteriota bacterium]